MWSAHTEAELGVLLQRVCELLENAQGVLQLGVEPTPPVKDLVAAAGDPGLFEISGTDSRVLFTALAGVFTS